MGTHYCCPTCQQHYDFCNCPRTEPPPEPLRYIVDREYNIMTVEHYKELYGLMGLFSKERYETKKEAEAARFRLIAEQINILTAKLATLHKLVEPPVKKKKTGNKCVECKGTGEQGGQFCGGFWKCEACEGTGKTLKLK